MKTVNHPSPFSRNTNAPVNQKCADALALARAHQALQTHRSVWSYARACWREATLYMLWKRCLTAFRRFRLVTLILRISAFLLAALETGALVLLSGFLLLLCLPVLIFLSLMILITALWEAPQKNREILAKIAQKRIYVLFLEEGSGAFFKANVYDLASRENSAVVIISPFWFSTRGIAQKRGFYVTAREEMENVFLVRRYYFFALKKHVLGTRSCAYIF